MTPTKTKFLVFLGAAALLLGITLISKCSREREVREHGENRREILKSDSLLSIIDTRYRAKLDSMKTAYQDTLRNAKENYKVIVQKDVRIEYRYREAPSIAGCDSVITSKNSRIGALESMALQQEQVSRVNDSLLASYAGTVRAKDQTIHQLNAGYEQAITDLQKAKRPRRVVVSAQVGYVMGIDLIPKPGVGFGIGIPIVSF